MQSNKSQVFGCPIHAFAICMQVIHCRKMNGLLFFGLVATAFGVVHATYKSSDFTDAERWEAAQQGVQHAHAKVQSYKETQERAAAASNPSDLSAMLLAKFFRRASPRSEEMGHARVFIEEAVKQTERILFEKERANIAPMASQEEKAEILAAELFHKPGSILSEKEYAHIYQESNCSMLTETVGCSADSTVRTPDGTCNNLMKPTQGAYGTAFGRLLPPHYEDGLFMPNGLRQSKFRDYNFRNGSAFSPPYPSARLVSINIVRDRKINDANKTHLLMQWGQFVDHDLDLSVEFSGAETICKNFKNCESNEMCAPIPVAEDDQVFGVGKPRDGGCLPFVRSIPACPNDPHAFVPREQINEQTSYIDGSVVYGPTATVATNLRDDDSGLLKASDPIDGAGQNRENLPQRNATDELPCPRKVDKCFFAGDVRVNEQLSLTVMQTIWLREHNRIARALKDLNPHFDNENLYQESRKIVIAQFQQIVFKEFLPIILGPTSYALLGPYPGYQSNVDVFIPNAFATAAYRFGHSQIQPQFDRLDSEFLPISRGPLSLVDAFMNPEEFFNGGGTDPIVRGWVTQPARKLDEFLNSILTSQLFEIKQGMGMDLAALNVQRGRDHGLPPYLVWKNYCEERYKMSSDFTNELTKIRLLKTYGSLDTVDLFVGALAEEPLPDAEVGATLACIFVITFSRLRDGDRFWYENNVFSAAQLAQIENTSLAKVLCDNTDIGKVQLNPFMLGQDMQECADIPGISFDPPFKDNNIAVNQDDPLCYIAIKVDPASRSDLNIFSGQAQLDTDICETFRKRDVSLRRVCAPFRCPNSLSNTLVLSSFGDCEVTVVRAPANTPNSIWTSVYKAIFTPSDIQANGNGLYTTNAQCESDSSTIAISYMCDRAVTGAPSSSDVTTADLEHELARILSDTSDTPTNSQANTRLETCNMESCTTDPTIPDEICRQIGNFLDNPSKAVKASEEVRGNSSEDKTEELIDLLEATLQELKEN